MPTPKPTSQFRSTSTSTSTSASASASAGAATADPTSPTATFPLDADGLLASALLRQAARRIRATFAPTPLVFCEARRAWLKLENLQVTGAYKVRGAFNALAAQVERGDRRAVFAASAGNHGLGVAWAARRFGLQATIVVPAAAPAAKVAGCRALGARVVNGGDGFESCLHAGQALARARGGRFLHAFDDPEVIAGQSTVAMELLRLRPDVVLIPVGGGGLTAGMGSLLKRAGVRVVGVQVAGVDALRRALAGQAAQPPRPTLADGLRVAAPGRLTLRICAALLDDIVTVEEDEVAAAVASLATRDRIIAEGAGAVAVAALPRVTGERRAAVISGGNIDAAVLARLMAAAPPAAPAPAPAASPAPPPSPSIASPSPPPTSRTAGRPGRSGCWPG
jgi:threonine dehydratase